MTNATTSRPGVPSSAQAGPGGYLTFRLGGQVYALALEDVTEIVEYRPLTVVPMMPAVIRGVINLRGRVVPVIDLVVRFGNGTTEVGHRSGIVIVEVSGPDRAERQVGVMVDGVNKVVHLGPGDIEPSPTFGSGIRADFITGMAKQDDSFVIVLDIGKVLTLDELPVLDEAVSAGELSADEEALSA